MTKQEDEIKKSLLLKEYIELINKVIPYANSFIKNISKYEKKRLNPFLNFIKKYFKIDLIGSEAKLLEYINKSKNEVFDLYFKSIDLEHIDNASESFTSIYQCVIADIDNMHRVNDILDISIEDKLILARNYVNSYIKNYAKLVNELKILKLI